MKKMNITNNEMVLSLTNSSCRPFGAGKPASPAPQNIWRYNLRSNSMKFKGIILISVLLIPLSAYCGGKRELIMELLDVTNARDNHEVLLSSYEQQFKSNPVTSTPEFRAYFREAMSWEGLVEPTIEVYEKTYTEEEIQGLISFYKSPIGIAYINKMPELNKQCSEIIMRRMNQAMHHLQSKN
jgi:uncharacterized protein